MIDFDVDEEALSSAARFASAASLATLRSSARRFFSSASFGPRLVSVDTFLSHLARPLSSPRPASESEDEEDDEESDSQFSDLPESESSSEPESDSESDADFLEALELELELELDLDDLELPLELELLLEESLSESLSESLLLAESSEELLPETTGFFLYSSIMASYCLLCFLNVNFIRFKARPLVGLNFLNPALSAKLVFTKSSKSTRMRTKNRGTPPCASISFFDLVMDFVNSSNWFCTLAKSRIFIALRICLTFASNDSNALVLADLTTLTESSESESSLITHLSFPAPAAPPKRLESSDDTDESDDESDDSDDDPPPAAQKRLIFLLLLQKLYAILSLELGCYCCRNATQTQQKQADDE
mmetsp:Transcript_15203/g.22621  ORF Transcript_15203/g.22621 Transcript_15203/m.22621 type:complete len:363 (-) Transcript_15203:80-1168(-)